MNETHPHDLNDRLDQAIDALNREASPAPFEHGNLELISLIDTARLMKSLRDPAEAEPGLTAQAVNRIAGEMSRIPATSNTGIPPASTPNIQSLDSADSGRSKTPRLLRTKLSEVSELVAVLLVIFIVVGGVALSQTVFSDGAGEPTAGGSGPIDPNGGPAQVLSELQLGGGTTCCAVYGEIDGESYLFAMTLGGGEQPGHGLLRSLQLDDEGTLQEVGAIESPLPFSFDSLSGRSRIALVDDVLYLPIPGQDESGLWVVDVSNPAAPEELAVVEMDRLPVTVAASGNLMAVATQDFAGPFLFFNVSDPDNPQLVSEYEHSVTSLPPSIMFEDSLLYILDESGVAIIDVSAPDAPREVGSVPNPDWQGPPTSTGLTRGISSIAPDDTFLGFAASGDYLYIAASNDGVRVVDISDPANPRETDQVELPGHAVHVAALDKRVYALGVTFQDDSSTPFHYATHVIDTSDTGQPQLIGTIDGPELSGPVQSLILGNNAIYLLEPFGTVKVIGNSPAAQPDDEALEPPAPTETTPNEPDSTPLPDGTEMSRGLSFAEAQEITPFELIEPEPLPESLKFIGADVRLASDTNPVDEAYFMYRLVDGEIPDEPIVFKQSNAVGEVRHPETVEETIGNRTVTTFHTAMNDAGMPLAVYAWTEGGITGRSYMVSVRLAGNITEQHLEALIAALPDANTDASSEQDSIVERFQKTQAEVDFELVMPAQIEGFELQENALSVSGPPTAPGVNATFIDNSNSLPRMLAFAQRPGGFGDNPSREGDEAVPVTIQGIETILYREPREGELPILRVRWEMNGIHYDVGATNVEEEDLLEIVNSIVPLSEIDGVGETTPPTSGPDALIEDPVEFVLTYLQAEGLQRFDPARGTFAGWLFTIARRRIADRGRSRARFRKLVERVRPQEPEARVEDVLDTTIHREDALLARQLLATLSGRDRGQVLPRYSAGMNSAEIADALGMRSGRLIASSEDGYGASIRSYSVT